MDQVASHHAAWKPSPVASTSDRPTDHLRKWTRMGRGGRLRRHSISSTIYTTCRQLQPHRSLAIGPRQSPVPSSHDRLRSLKQIAATLQHRTVLFSEPHFYSRAEWIRRGLENHARGCHRTPENHPLRQLLPPPRLLHPPRSIRAWGSGSGAGGCRR